MRKVFEICEIPGQGIRIGKPKGTIQKSMFDAHVDSIIKKWQGAPFIYIWGGIAVKVLLRLTDLKRHDLIAI